ncbi:hypothetical protein UC34_10495 [Pandoraea vervacti]|uniref:ShET2 enterotoxin N-terminal domain-containing protein n=1 Tax=Pandoraea vervacti TaxID=656178 RepID=A0ABM5SXM3_9BURK|nr:deaminase domain-containing protein [Pandoraea vervacti]AJP57319.1 hypothetical protein UC34_10495 [Pandoraea vervacti]
MLPATPTTSATRSPPGAATANPTSKRDAPMGLFVHNDQYVRVNTSGSRLSVLSADNAQLAGLPPVPQHLDTIEGRLADTAPIAQTQRAAAQSDMSTQPPSSSLVSLTLTNLVAGIPFEKTVFGMRLPGQPSSIVVQADRHRYYVSHRFRPESASNAFHRLDPDVPDDKRLIDLYCEGKQQFKTPAAELRRTSSFRNVLRQLEAQAPPRPKSRPLSCASDEAVRIFTSQNAQQAFVCANKASLSSRNRFHPEHNGFDLAVYRTILGPELVFETDGEWNIGHAAGVADLKSQLRENNFAFASVETPSGRKVYFSLSGGMRAKDVTLAIHRTMGDADEVAIGPITFIDAKRRLARAVLESPDSPSKTAMQMNLPVLDPACATTADRVNDAEQIIATVVARDARHAPLVGGIHFNTLLDTCDSCASTLALLQTQTKRPVSVVYHRDYGVTTANSRNPTILAIQQFAAAVNELHAHLITGDIAAMIHVARRLPVPPLLDALSNALLRFDGRFTDAAHLGLMSNACYLRLLGVLARTEIVRTRTITDTLLSPEGKAYVSLLATRVAMHPMLARAWVSLLDDLKKAGADRVVLMRVLLSKPGGCGRCFYVELLRAAHTPGDVRNALVAWLKSADLVPRLRESLAFVSLRTAVKLTARRWLQVDVAQPLTFEHVTLKEVLLSARESLSLSALNTADNLRLATKMREAMPTIKTAEVRAFRDMIDKLVAKAWHDVLPNSAPPAHIAKAIVETHGAEYGSAVAAARKQARDAIIDEHVAVYAEFQRRHPGASQDALQSQFETCLRAARAAYLATIADTAEPAATVTSSTQSQAERSAQEAARKAKMRKHTEAALTSAHVSALSAAVQAANDAMRENVRRQAEDAACAAKVDARKAAAMQAEQAAVHAAAIVAGQAKQWVRHEVNRQAQDAACDDARAQATQTRAARGAERSGERGGERAAQTMPSQGTSPHADVGAATAGAANMPEGLENVYFPAVPEGPPQRAPREHEMAYRLARLREGSAHARFEPPQRS